MSDKIIDAFELAKQMEESWRQNLLQSIASGAMSGKDIKNVNVYIKVGDDYKQVTNAYSHHGLGVVLETIT